MTTRREPPPLTNWQDVQDYHLLVSVLRKAMVEADERAVRVAARDLLLAIGQPA